MSKNMKLEEKLIQNVRINPSRAMKLRKAVLSIEKQTGTRIKESDLINFLLDEGLERLSVRKDELKLI